LLVNLQPRHTKINRYLEEQLNSEERESTLLHVFPDMDIALEWCENRLIEQLRTDDDDHKVTLAEHDLCRGLTPNEVATLESLLKSKSYRSGDLIIRKGDPAAEIFLLMSGEVSVRVDLPNGQIKRLSTLSAGMAFGEIAVINRTVRSADVYADTEVECYLLSTSSFDELGRTHPTIKMTLLQNLLHNFSRMLKMAEREVTTLSL
jgi:glutaminase